MLPMELSQRVYPPGLRPKAQLKIRGRPLDTEKFSPKYLWGTTTNKKGEDDK